MSLSVTDSLVKNMIDHQSRMLVFYSEPLGAHGGMEHFDDSYCSALVKQGLDVKWATCNETALLVSDYELWTPFCEIFGNTPGWRRSLSYAKGLWLVLRRACREQRRHFVVVHHHFITVLPLEWCFAILLRICGIPRVISPHDAVPYNMSGWITRLLPGFYRQFDFVISHNQQDLAYLQQVRGDPHRVRYVPLGNFNQMHCDVMYPTCFEARTQLNLPASAPIMLFQGRVREEKGLEYLIRALPDVLRELPDTILLIAGQPGHQGVERYELLIDQLGVRDHIRTRWEFIPDSELPAYYLASNVVVLPYTHVYQSAVVMMAYAFRRTVVASNVGGLSEQIKDGETGLLVPSRDSRALTAALLKVLQDSVLASQMGEAGHKWASELGNWDAIGEKTVQVYGELCAIKKEKLTRASRVKSYKSEVDS